MLDLDLCIWYKQFKSCEMTVDAVRTLADTAHVEGRRIMIASAGLLRPDVGATIVASPRYMSHWSTLIILKGIRIG